MISVQQFYRDWKPSDRKSGVVTERKYLWPDIFRPAAYIDFMTNEPMSEKARSLPYRAYRFGSYVAPDVKVVILLSGSDDGSMPAFADKWTTPEGKADFAGMLGQPYTDTDAWDFGCEGRNEWSSSVAAVGFLEDFDRKHMDAFAKAHPDLWITVSYESGRYNGHCGYRRGKYVDGRHTLNVWRANDGTGMKDLPYEEFVALEGEGSW